MTSPRPYPDPNSRFQVRESPVLSPGKCMVCGNVGRPVLDFGLELNVEGYAYRAYLCILCAEEAANTLQAYKEYIGEAKGEAELITEYLEKNELKVISNERFNDILFWISGLSGAVDFVLADPHNAEEDAEGESRDSTEDESVEQSDDSDTDGELPTDNREVASFSL